jgi:hypothetical protein
MRKSVFEVLRREGLTHLKIAYDWRKDHFSFFSAREWDRDTPFREYNRSFTLFTLYPTEGVYRNSERPKRSSQSTAWRKHLRKIMELCARAGTFFSTVTTTRAWTSASSTTFTVTNVA